MSFSSTSRPRSRAAATSHSASRPICTPALHGNTRNPSFKGVSWRFLTEIPSSNSRDTLSTPKLTKEGWEYIETSNNSRLASLLIKGNEIGREANTNRLFTAHPGQRSDAASTSASRSLASAPAGLTFPHSSSPSSRPDSHYSPRQNSSAAAYRTRPSTVHGSDRDREPFQSLQVGSHSDSHSSSPSSLSASNRKQEMQEKYGKTIREVVEELLSQPEEIELEIQREHEIKEKLRRENSLRESENGDLTENNNQNKNDGENKESDGEQTAADDPASLGVPSSDSDIPPSLLEFLLSSGVAPVDPVQWKNNRVVREVNDLPSDIVEKLGGITKQRGDGVEGRKTLKFDLETGDYVVEPTKKELEAARRMAIKESLLAEVQLGPDQTEGAKAKRRLEALRRRQDVHERFKSQWFKTERTRRLEAEEVRKEHEKRFANMEWESKTRKFREEIPGLFSAQQYKVFLEAQAEREREFKEREKERERERERDAAAAQQSPRLPHFLANVKFDGSASEVWSEPRRNEKERSRGKEKRRPAEEIKRPAEPMPRHSPPLKPAEIDTELHHELMEMARSSDSADSMLFLSKSGGDRNPNLVRQKEKVQEMHEKWVKSKSNAGNTKGTNIDELFQVPDPFLAELDAEKDRRAAILAHQNELMMFQMKEMEEKRKNYVSQNDEMF